MTSGILGGIGLGLQKGVSYMQHQDNLDRDYALRERQDARVAEQQDWQREQQDQIRRERESTAKQQEIWRQYGDKDLSDPKVFDEFSKAVVPHMTPAQIAAVQTQAKSLRTMAGKEAVDRFMYNDGDLSGFQQVLEAQVPGAKLTKQGDRIVLSRPDGETKDFASVKGMIAMFGIDGALERMAEASTAKAASDKEASATDLNRAKSDYYRKRGQAAQLSGRGAGLKGAGGSKGAVKDDPATGPKTLNSHFKDPGDAQEFFLKGIGEQGLEYVNADGEAGFVPREAAATQMMQYADALLGQNTGLPIAKAREIAADMVRVKAGMPPEKGVYQPAPMLNPQTLEWETAIRTKDGEMLAYPTAIVAPSEDEMFQQEADVARKLVDNGDSAALGKLLKEKPEILRLFTHAINGDAEAVRKISAQDPLALRKFDLLYRHTGLGGLIVPDQNMVDKRQAVLARRKGAAPASKQAKEEPRQSPQWSDKERSRAEQIGAGRATDIGDAIAEGAAAVGEGWKRIGEKVTDVATDRAFRLSLDANRKTNFRVGNMARSLADMLKKNPDLRQYMTDDDLIRLQFAIDERID